MVGTLPASVHHHHGIKANGAPFAAQRYRCSLSCRASFLSRIAVPPPSQNSNLSPIPQLLLVKQQKSVFAHDSKPSHYHCYSCSRAPPLLSLLRTLTTARSRRRRINYSSDKDDCDGCSHQLKSPQNEIFQRFWRRRETINNYRQTITSAVRKMTICKVTGDSESERDLKSDVVSESETNMEEEREEEGESESVLTQVALWILAAVYTSWLFLLPYAPVRLSISLSLSNSEYVAGGAETSFMCMMSDFVLCRVIQFGQFLVQPYQKFLTSPSTSSSSFHWQTWVSNDAFLTISTTIISIM